jgi:hypothetical protein
MFFANLINSLQNYDHEERRLIKLLIYKIYSCSMIFRKMIIRSIENKLIDLAYDISTKVNHIIGLSELLDILSKIN